MCWQNDVQLSLAEDEDPRNFMVVKSGSYVLAIPDLGHYARQEADMEQPTARFEGSSSISSYRQLAIFKKTIMKLNGNVRWVAGLVFERNLDGGGRSFKFSPHYDIVLKHPKHAQPQDGKVSIHMKIGRFITNRSRNMMHSVVSEAIIFICPLLSQLPMIANGLLVTWNLLRLTTVFTLPQDSSRISTTGGPCSRVPCLCQ